VPTAAEIWSPTPAAAPTGVPATAIWGPQAAPRAPAPGTTAAAGDPTDPTSLAGGYAAEGVDPDLSNSLIHNVMKPLHNMAMGVENGLAWLGDKVDPKTGNTLSSTITGQQQRSGWNQKLQDTVNSDRQAMKDWEAQYQASQPDNAANPRPDNRSGRLSGETPDLVDELLHAEASEQAGAVKVRLWDPSTQLRFRAKRSVPPRPDGSPNAAAADGRGAPSELAR